MKLTPTQRRRAKRAVLNELRHPLATKVIIVDDDLAAIGERDVEWPEVVRLLKLAARAVREAK